MQIVIEIPKEDYEYLKAHHSHEVFYGDAIANGIPLPEHYGDLVDKDKLKKCIPSEEFGALFAVENAPTIIPATERSNDADID